MIKTMPLYIVSGVVALVAFFVGLTNSKFLFITSPRMAVITVTAAGFLMCTSGAIGLFVTKAPVNLLTVLGYVLGIAALAIGIIFIFNIKMPFSFSANAALITIMIIIILKVIIARIGAVIIK